MQQEHPFGKDLTELERTLTTLVPAPSRLDIPQTMFLAGQQSMRRRQRWQRIWPLASAGLAVLCLALGIVATRPHEPLIVYVDRDISAQRISAPEKQLAAAPTSESSEHDAAAAEELYQLSVRAAEQRRLKLLALQNLAVLDNWKTASSVSQTDQASIHAMRYRDWRSLLDNPSPTDPLPANGNASPSFPWSILMNEKGTGS